MRTVIITFRNGKQLKFDDPQGGFNTHKIIKGVPVVFNNLWFDTVDIMIIEVKENEK